MKHEQYKQLHAGKKDETLPCHVLYLSDISFNCQLTPEQAVKLAGRLKAKADSLLKNKVTDGVVHLWRATKRSASEKSPPPKKRRILENIICGTHKKTKNPGRNSSVPVKP